MPSCKALPSKWPVRSSDRLRERAEQRLLMDYEKEEHEAVLEHPSEQKKPSKQLKSRATKRPVMSTLKPRNIKPNANAKVTAKKDVKVKVKAESTSSYSFKTEANDENIKMEDQVPSQNLCPPIITLTTATTSATEHNDDRASRTKTHGKRHSGWPLMTLNESESSTTITLFPENDSTESIEPTPTPTPLTTSPSPPLPSLPLSASNSLNPPNGKLRFRQSRRELAKYLSRCTLGRPRIGVGRQNDKLQKQRAAEMKQAIAEAIARSHQIDAEQTSETTTTTTTATVAEQGGKKRQRARPRANTTNSRQGGKGKERCFEDQTDQPTFVSDATVNSSSMSVSSLSCPSSSMASLSIADDTTKESENPFDATKILGHDNGELLFVTGLFKFNAQDPQWIRVLLRGWLYSFFQFQQPSLNPLAATIFAMPRPCEQVVSCGVVHRVRIIVPPHADATDENAPWGGIRRLWSVPVLDPLTKKILAIVRTDQLACWLRIRMSELLGFLTMAHLPEWDALQEYLLFRIKFVMILQGEPEFKSLFQHSIDSENGSDRPCQVSEKYRRLAAFFLEKDHLQRMQLTTKIHQSVIARRGIHTDLNPLAFLSETQDTVQVDESLVGIEAQGEVKAESGLFVGSSNTGQVQPLEGCMMTTSQTSKWWSHRTAFDVAHYQHQFDALCRMQKNHFERNANNWSMLRGSFDLWDPDLTTNPSLYLYMARTLDMVMQAHDENHRIEASKPTTSDCNSNNNGSTDHPNGLSLYSEKLVLH
ncbi:hypothetical protein BGZ94_002876 [Podila epigama]|nr:hypothetical protein BGZ94_002876 [Podila epigama]